MAYYRICPICGAHLDPGEECDCHLEQERKEKEKQKHDAEIEAFLRIEKNGQMRLAV